MSHFGGICRPCLSPVVPSIRLMRLASIWILDTSGIVPGCCKRSRFKAVVHRCLGRCFCLACMPTRLGDQCACTSAPVWQLPNSTSAVSSVFFHSLEPFACSGITVGTSNGAFDWTVPHLSSLRCRSHTLPTPHRAALRVLQVSCLWRFRHADYLHHVGALSRRPR